MEIPLERRENIMSEHSRVEARGGKENFIESYCVKIANIPIHLINQIKDQESELALRLGRGWLTGCQRRGEKNGIFSYLFLIRMDYTPRKLQSKLMRILTQMYAFVFVFPLLRSPSPHKGASRDYLKVCERKIFGSMSTGAVGRGGWRREKTFGTHRAGGWKENEQQRQSASLHPSKTTNKDLLNFFSLWNLRFYLLNLFSPPRQWSKTSLRGERSPRPRLALPHVSSPDNGARLDSSSCLAECISPPLGALKHRNPPPPA